MAIKAGDQAPDFKLPRPDGTLVSLSALLHKGAVVLYFYPKDDTRGCTIEACSFRDSYEAFKDAGAEVVGISSDSAASHEQFVRKYQLPFTLVSDAGGKVRKAYGVPSTLGILPGRVTYIIDAHGTVQHVFNSQIHAGQHVVEALAVLRRVQGPVAVEPGVR